MKKWRNDFPILNTFIHGKPLVYLDNAATTQKPVQVLNALDEYYVELNSNIHRGAHYLSNKGTEAFEASRCYIAELLNAKSACEVIFTKGTTESINIVARCFGQAFINEGDEVVISALEHHANIVPWQMMCEERKAVLKVIPIDERGVIITDVLDEVITERVKIVAITYASNALGTIQPIDEVIRIAHNKGAVVLIDGAQAVSHYEIDVQAMDCDFFVFSGHKVYSTMGVGVLYGKEELLNKMPPFLGGGEMIDQVTFEKTTYNGLPFKFEGGTPDVGGVLALRRAFEYVNEIGLQSIAEYEHKLLMRATEGLFAMGDVELYGLAENKTAVISFNIKTVQSSDTGTILDMMGIAVRTGHHCAQPLMNILKVSGTVRASFAFYNTEDEVDIFLKGVESAKRMLL